MSHRNHVPTRVLERKLWDFDFLFLGEGQPSTSTPLHGATVAVVGKNGSGKTDFLRNLTFALDPSMEVPNAKHYFWTCAIVLPKLHPEEIDVSEEGSSHWRLRSLKNILTLSGRAIRERAVIPQNSMLSLLDEDHWYPNWNLWSEAAEEFRKFSRVILIPHESPNFTRRSFADEVSSAEHLVSFIQFMNEDTVASSQMLRDLQRNLLETLEVKDSDELNDFFVNLYLNTDVSKRKNPLLTPFFFDPEFTWWLEPSDGEWASSVKWAAERTHPAVISWPHQMDSSLVQICVDASLLEFSGATDVEILLSTIGDSGPLRTSKSNRAAFREDSLERMRKLMSREKLDLARDLLLEWGILQPYVDNQGERDPGFSSHLGLYKDMVSFGFSGEANETIRVWTRRILQCLQLSESDSLLKVALWDEPERGLHPEAIDFVAENALAWVESLGIKLIYATHSTAFTNAARTLVETKRRGPSVQLASLPDLGDEKFLELGFTKADLLLRRTCFIFVEGDHDEIVLREFYQNELSRGRTRILPFGGTHQLDIGLVATELRSRILLVLDGGYKSGIDEGLIERINSSMAQKDSQKFSQALQELQVLVGKSKRSEAATLSKFLGVIRNSQGSLDSSRFSIFLLKQRDITRYFELQELYRDPLPYKSWAEVETELRNKGIDQQPKEFLKTLPGKPKVSKALLAIAARKKLDEGLPSDFERLREWIV